MYMTRRKMNLIADNYVQWCERVFKNKSNQTNLKLMSARATQKFVLEISFYLQRCGVCCVTWTVRCVVCDMDWVSPVCGVRHELCFVCGALCVACVRRVSLRLASMLTLHLRVLRRRGASEQGWSSACSTPDTPTL
jgi:hypothetical protein